MNKSEAEEIFTKVHGVWESGTVDDVKKTYHPDFIEYRHGKMIDIHTLIDRFRFAKMQYNKVRYTLDDIVKVNENQFLTLSTFYAVDAKTKKPAEMMVCTLFQLEKKQIYRGWVVSNNKIDIALDMSEPEDLTVQAAQRKKLEQRLEMLGRERNDVVGLTKREIDCLYLYLIGLSLKQIGTELNISATTVETHLRKIQKKYGFANKVELKKKFKLI